MIQRQTERRTTSRSTKVKVTLWHITVDKVVLRRLPHSYISHFINKVQTTEDEWKNELKKFYMKYSVKTDLT